MSYDRIRKYSDTRRKKELIDYKPLDGKFYFSSMLT